MVEKLLTNRNQDIYQMSHGRHMHLYYIPNDYYSSSTGNRLHVYTFDSDSEHFRDIAKNTARLVYTELARDRALYRHLWINTKYQPKRYRRVVFWGVVKARSHWDHVLYGKQALLLTRSHTSHSVNVLSYPVG